MANASTSIEHVAGYSIRSPRQRPTRVYPKDARFFVYLKQKDNSQKSTFSRASRITYVKAPMSPPPTKYNLASEIGRSKGGVYSFGKLEIKCKSKGFDFSLPGPGSYEIAGLTGKSQKFSFRIKTPVAIRPVKTPGPGSYDIAQPLLNRKPAVSCFSSSQRFTNLGREQWPGPGHYQLMTRKIKGNHLFNRFKGPISTTISKMDLNKPFATVSVLRAATPGPNIKGLRGEFFAIHPKTTYASRIGTPALLSGNRTIRPSTSMGKSREHHKVASSSVKL